MTAAAVGETPPTIKPDDMVRLPNGNTGTVLTIEAGGIRTVHDLDTGTIVRVHRDDLYLVRAAKPKPWPDRRP